MDSVSTALGKSVVAPKEAVAKEPAPKAQFNPVDKVESKSNNSVRELALLAEGESRKLTEA